MKESSNKVVVVVGIVLLVGGIVGYIFGRSQDASVTPRAGMMDTQSENMHRMSDGTMMHHDDMMMDHADMMVTSERTFIEGMIPHHQEAIDTAKEVLERGGATPEMRALAEEIIIAQEAEIVEMKQWYQDWYGEAYQDTGEYMPMMRDLSQLDGRDLDRVFLEDMVMHHMGAIMMARSVQPYVEHDEMINLTRAVIETQSEEIQLMRQMLRE